MPPPSRSATPAASSALENDFTLRHGHAVLRQDGLRLILVNLHRVIEQSYDASSDVDVAFRRVFSSSVGTKLLIGLTGLLLFAYLLLHLAGNLLVFAGPDTFNHYSHTLVSNPLVVPAEIGLLAALPAAHLQDGDDVDCATSAARPVGYAKKSWAGHPSRKSLASTTMIWTGLVIAASSSSSTWQQFKFGALVRDRRPADPRPRTAPRSRSSSSPLWVGVYVVCMVLVGLHLRHGIVERVPVARRRSPGLHEAARGCSARVARDPDRRRLRHHSDLGVSARDDSRLEDSRRARWRTSGIATASNRSWSTRRTAASTRSSSSAPAWPARRRPRRSASSATTSRASASTTARGARTASRRRAASTPRRTTRTTATASSGCSTTRSRAATTARARPTSSGWRS